MRLPWCRKQRQDALETRPLSGFVVPKTSPPNLLGKDEKHEQACIALDDRCRRLSAARGPSTENGLGQGCRHGKALIADRDNKIWLVSNAETLSGIEGRHAEVKALVDAAQRQIRIMSVSAISEEQAGTRLHDAAFRR